MKRQIKSSAGSFPQQSRRHISGSSRRRTSTSPQRRAAAAALATAMKPFTDVPGPLALPMLRHSAHVLPRIGSFHHTVGLGLLEGLRDRYGDLVRLAKASRTRPVLYVFDPEMMREVYESRATEPPQWERAPLTQSRNQRSEHCPVHVDETKAIWAGIRELLQDGTMMKSYDKVFDDIATDATRRSKAVALSSSAALVDSEIARDGANELALIYSDLRAPEGQNKTNAGRLGDLRYAENALNEEMETEVYRWALETVGMMVFGIRLGCLDGAVHVPTADNKKPEKTSLDDDTPELCSLSKRAVEELTPAERLVRCTRDIADGNYLVRSEATLKEDSQTFNKALKTFDMHFSLTEHFLLQALKNLSSEDRRPEQLLLDKLRPLDRRLLPLAADVFLAGVDPLAQTALSMLYQLSLHAAQQQRAHDEVRWAVDAAAADAGSAHAPYVAACAREALRLHPATGGVVRRSRESLVVAGYEVPAGVDIVLAHGVSSKSEKQWGRAKAFIPERWCSEGWQPLRASRAHPLASLPFGETCPAAGIAGPMLAALAARVLDKYRLEWHGPAPSMVTAGVNRLQPPFYFVLQNAA